MISSDVTLRALARSSLGGGYSVTGSFKEGLDENADPFNPGYIMPAFEIGRKFGRFYAGVGGRVYLPKEGEADPHATLAIGYTWRNVGIKVTPVIPVNNPGKTAVKLAINYTKN